MGWLMALTGIWSTGFPPTWWDPVWAAIAAVAPTGALLFFFLQALVQRRQLEETQRENARRVAESEARIRDENTPAIWVEFLEPTDRGERVHAHMRVHVDGRGFAFITGIRLLAAQVEEQLDFDAGERFERPVAAPSEHTLPVSWCAPDEDVDGRIQIEFENALGQAMEWSQPVGIAGRGEVNFPIVLRGAPSRSPGLGKTSGE